MHRNAHISNASHPLLVTYYCWVTVYSPSMKAKKKCQNNMTDSGSQADNTWDLRTCVCPLYYLWNRTDGSFFSFIKCRLLKLQIKTGAENGKIRLAPKITNHRIGTCTPPFTQVWVYFSWSLSKIRSVTFTRANQKGSKIGFLRVVTIKRNCR